jgi:hypothetical protein
MLYPLSYEGDGLLTCCFRQSPPRRPGDPVPSVNALSTHPDGCSKDR